MLFFTCHAMIWSFSSSSNLESPKLRSNLVPDRSTGSLPSHAATVTEGFHIYCDNKKLIIKFHRRSFTFVIDIVVDIYHHHHNLQLKIQFRFESYNSLIKHKKRLHAPHKVNTLLSFVIVLYAYRRCCTGVTSVERVTATGRRWKLTFSQYTRGLRMCFLKI